MAVSSTQVQFDSLFGLFTYLAIVVSIIVFSLLIYFMIKYRDRPSSRQPDDTPILGRTNVMWFMTYQQGNFTIQCFELCGTGHATMKGILNVVNETTFQQWYTHTRVTCAPISLAVNQTSQCTVSVSDSSPNGMGLTPKGNVTSSTPAPGYFNAPMCTL